MIGPHEWIVHLSLVQSACLCVYVWRCVWGGGGGGGGVWVCVWEGGGTLEIVEICDSAILVLISFAI